MNTQSELNQKHQQQEMVVVSVFFTKSQEKLFAKSAQKSMLKNAKISNQPN